MEYEIRSATYYVDNLKISKLFTDLHKDLSKGVFPILKLRILRYTLRNIFFTDDSKATYLLNTLSGWKKEKNCLESLKRILESLYELMIFDYLLYDSFIVNWKGIIYWDLDISVLLPN